MFKKSSWPFQPLLIQLFNGLEKAPAAVKAEAVMKTVERCFRLGVRLSVAYGVPASVMDALYASAVKADGTGKFLVASPAPKAPEAAVEAASPAPEGDPEVAQLLSPETEIEVMFAALSKGAKPKAQA